MPRKVVPLETKALAALASGRLSGSVSEFCAVQGISRKTFYKWRTRFAAEGWDGLAERSRRPRSSPGAVSAAVDDDIVRLRKELADAGLDHGAATIRWHLERAGVAPVPAVSTIHRRLTARGMVTSQPAKRPKSAIRRFEFPCANDCWQIDATSVRLRNGRQAWVIDLIDDCSRVIVAARAARSENALEVWDAFVHASARWGMPARVLSDNALCYSGRIRGVQVDFEQNLRALGIQPITSTPHHPQTCGKIERWHQTLKQRLAARPTPADLTELQAELDDFVELYNTRRPHRGIGRITPIERWTTTHRAGPAHHPLPTPPEIVVRTVSAIGTYAIDNKIIAVGREWAGHDLTIIRVERDVWAFHGPTFVRHTTINPNQRYQPSGLPTGAAGHHRTRQLLSPMS